MKYATRRLFMGMVGVFAALGLSSKARANPNGDPLLNTVQIGSARVEFHRDTLRVTQGGATVSWDWEEVVTCQA